MRKAAHQPEQTGRDPDLQLSHAFVSSIDACYSGLWAFERTLSLLEPEMDRDEELERAQQVLDRADGWWERLEDGRSLIRMSDKPVLDDEGSRAWRLLHVAEGRLRSLITELIQSSDLEVLVEDPFSRNVRVAAFYEAARIQEETVRGMVWWAERYESDAVAESWRQRSLECQSRVKEAERFVREIAEHPEPDEQVLRELLDCSLLLPARFAERVVELCHVFSMYTGVFDYRDVGIPDAQVEIWQDSGFDAYAAGRWFAAGLAPEDAVEWISTGAKDPMIAAGFMWRGFTPDEAAPWLDCYLGGRSAYAWRIAGCGPEDAREWISLGILTPAQMPLGGMPDQVM